MVMRTWGLNKKSPDLVSDPGFPLTVFDGLHDQFKPVRGAHRRVYFKRIIFLVVENSEVVIRYK